MRIICAVFAIVLSAPLLAVELDTPFSNIDGGTHKLADWEGQPVLVVNTASLCGFTHQFSALQTLHETYEDRGLVVLAVPSDDFAQELASEDEVKHFCEVNYDLTLPMTGITNVVGQDAHPFYRSLEQETGFTPTWNFNKVLLDTKGNVAATFRSITEPMSPEITEPIEEMLSQAGG